MSNRTEHEHKRRSFQMVLILFIFTILVTSVLQAAIGEGAQSGNGGDSGQGDGSSGDCNKTQEQNQDCDCGCNQTQEQDREREQSGNCTCDGGMYQYRYENKAAYCYSKQGNGDGNGSAWRHKYRNEINQGAENETVAMECTFTHRERYMLQENNHYLQGMMLQLMETSRNRIKVIVSAEFDEGKVVALNIEEKVLKFGEPSNIKAYLDGEPVEAVSVEELLEAEGAEAKYVGAVSEGGAQFLVYIPHFSEHVIEIESLLGYTKEQLFTGTNFIVLGLSILVLIGLSGHVYRIGKSRA